MKKTALAALVLAATLPSAGAVTISLFDYGVNIDGDVKFPTMGDPLQSGVDISAFDTVTGLGTVSIQVTTVGSHYVGLYVDHDIDDALNTFFNETGAAVGAVAAGQTWEIDEPGFISGDIVTNFSAGMLDNSVSPFGPDDPAMALAWNLTLGANESVTVKFVVSETAPADGFYLVQSDPDSQASIYFSSTATFGDTEPPPPIGIPDSGFTLTLLLLGVSTSFGLAAKFRGQS